MIRDVLEDIFQAQDEGKGGKTMSEELADGQRDVNDVNEGIRQLDREWSEA